MSLVGEVLLSEEAEPSDEEEDLEESSSPSSSNIAFFPDDFIFRFIVAVDVVCADCVDSRKAHCLNFSLGGFGGVGLERLSGCTALVWTLVEHYSGAHQR
jgi:hypothetical protein